jgi:hypothetical protein
MRGEFLARKLQMVLEHQADEFFGGRFWLRAKPLARLRSVAEKNINFRRESLFL